MDVKKVFTAHPAGRVPGSLDRVGTRRIGRRRRPCSRREVDETKAQHALGWFAQARSAKWSAKDSRRLVGRPVPCQRFPRRVARSHRFGCTPLSAAGAKSIYARPLRRACHHQVLSRPFGCRLCRLGQVAPPITASSGGVSPRPLPAVTAHVRSVAVPSSAGSAQFPSLVPGLPRQGSARRVGHRPPPSWMRQARCVTERSPAEPAQPGGRPGVEGPPSVAVGCRRGLVSAQKTPYQDVALDSCSPSLLHRAHYQECFRVTSLTPLEASPCIRSARRWSKLGMTSRPLSRPQSRRACDHLPRGFL